MKLNQTNRRGFIVRVLGLFSTVFLPACGRDRGNVDPRTVSALLDTLIPADQDPGAVAAGVPERIMAQLQVDPVSLDRYQRLLAWVDTRARLRNRQRFEMLTLSQREALLYELIESSGRGKVQLNIDLHVAMDHCFHEFYSSPAARRVIGYHPPIEGGYADYARSPDTVAR